jgi:GH25 family lysozyme M1 (1,4-beta-N-acetylmuramidase)
MKFSKRLISALLSCACTFYAAVPAMNYSNAEEAVVLSSYDNDSTNQEESKEVRLFDREVKFPEVSKPYDIIDMYDAHEAYIATMTTTSEVTTTTAPEIEEPVVTTTVPAYNTIACDQGIDVSEVHGVIDWESVASDSITFAIIRAGYGKSAEQKDVYFDQNVSGARSAYVDCGAYWYSYATSIEDAYAEAEACYEVIKDHNLNFPVFYCLGDECQRDLSAAQLSAIAETFCSALKDKGYYSGIYGYANFLSTKIYDNVLSKYEVWMANHDVESPGYDIGYDMWQYCANGSVKGIEGVVSRSVCYINYAYIISPDTYVTHTTTTTTTTTTEPEPVITTTTMDPVLGRAQGIDVSVWQDEIDWNTVKASGIDYVIIRAGYGNLVEQEDKRFRENIEGAHAAGLDVGVYWYSYADSADDARLEAEACYQVIKDYKLEYPVYYDIEDPSMVWRSNAELSDFTNAFCTTLSQKYNYYVGVYSYASFLTYQLEDYIINKFDIWVAHYGVNKPDFDRAGYGMWQYTGSGSVPGISTDVDMNHCYKDYASIMKQIHCNNY